jgi:putative hydrolases of HD superfamily
MAFMLSKRLAEYIFEAFSIQRWNDRIRVIDLTEMDKNAYKMMLSYFIGRVYEDNNSYINWQSMIDRGIYDLLIRISTSDIKASLHSKLREDKATYNTSVSKLIENDLHDKIYDPNFIQNTKDYIANNHKGSLSNEDLILRLSHNLAVRREYEIVLTNDFNKKLPENSKTIEELDAEVEYYANRLGMKDYVNSERFQGLMLAIDQLRFQQRWSQTPRIPKTNVLGHSFYVAVLCYFSTRNIFNNSMRLRNNFYSSLMHDFLESYTRDVINPIKMSSSYFNDQIADAETEAFDNKLSPLMEPCFSEHFSFLLRDEFSDRKLSESGNVEKMIKGETEQHGYEYADGTIVKACDSLAALIEAHQSIELGVSSRHLEGAITRVYSSFSKSNSMSTGVISSDEIRQGLLKVYDDFISM